MRTTEVWSVQRCTVSRWDDACVYAETAAGSVCLGGEAITAVRPLLRVGMQLNLITTRQPSSDEQEGKQRLDADIVVVEPDFLMDVTTVASCFARPDMHPLSYTLKRLAPRANSQAILLGNFAGAALDDIINHPTYDVTETLWRSYREQAMQF